MKHPQHILAVDKARFGLGDLGPLVMMSPKSFFEALTASLFIGRREELEKDERFAQVLPYIVLRKTAVDGSLTVLEYQRTSKVGERRLAGKHSIGTGGHVDLADVRMDDKSVIDVVGTIAVATARELNEEIAFHHPETNQTFGFDELRHGVRTKYGPEGFDFQLPPQPLHPRFCGVINDLSDAVGRVHMGCVFAVDVPPYLDPFCREEELVTIGMRSIEQIKGPGESTFGSNLENWSRLLVEDPAFIDPATAYGVKA
jgi:predicted NUDIX family phosphoesterase